MYAYTLIFPIMTHYALILAGGKGSRLNNTEFPKQFLEINKIPMLMHSIKAFNAVNAEIKIYVGLPKHHFNTWKLLCETHNFKIKHEIYEAGNERFDTTFLGLQTIAQNNDTSNSIVCIHDAARPFVTKSFIINLLKNFNKPEITAVIPTERIKNAIISSKNNIYESKNRDSYLLCQTPQCFTFQAIFKAYVNIMHKSKNPLIKDQIFRELHDDFSVLKTHFLNQKNSVKLVEGVDYNIKITTELDYFISEKIYQFYKDIQ